MQLRGARLSPLIHAIEFGIERIGQSSRRRFVVRNLVSGLVHGSSIARQKDFPRCVMSGDTGSREHQLFQSQRCQKIRHIGRLCGRIVLLDDFRQQHRQCGSVNPKSRSAALLIMRGGEGLYRSRRAGDTRAAKSGPKPYLRIVSIRVQEKYGEAFFL